MDVCWGLCTGVFGELHSSLSLGLCMTKLSVLSTQYTAVKTKDGELKFLSGGEDSDAEVPERTGYVPSGTL